MTEYEKMISGLLYNSSDEELINMRTKLRLQVDKFNRSSPADYEHRMQIIDEMIPHHGDNIYIEPNIRLEYGINLKIGKNFFLNFDSVILDVCPITIGDNVLIGPRVVIATPMHPLDYHERNTQLVDGKMRSLEYAKPITIGNNVWIASNVTICGGVTIGDNVVIGSGSVVTKDIPSDTLAYGVPCKPIRKITEKDRMYKEQGYDIYPTY
ncbi:MAG: sugar O-acetyltransferase [Christensenella sp.]|nr:sugar O-acetyltransferase [Christensenella sp.]